MSGYVCPGFGNMDIFSQTFTDPLGVYQCVTPVLKETYLKTLDLDEDESIFSMGDYCTKIYKNGNLEFLIFDEWREFYLLLQEEWFSNGGVHRNMTFDERTLRIHAGFEIQKPPTAINNLPGESSRQNSAATYSVQTYKSGIRHSYNITNGHVNLGDLHTLCLLNKEAFSADIHDYPQCVALQLKKGAKHFEFSQPFKCKNNTGWDLFLCRHEAYRSCGAKAGKLLGQYFYDDSGNCSRKYSVSTLNWEDLPYGQSCQSNYVNESAKCINCTGNWGVWTQWSSVCGWAYRIRSKHSIKHPHADCSQPEAPCCRQWSETNKEPCKNFVRGTSINLAKDSCTTGTKRIDTSGHYYCRCMYGSTGPLCQIKIKCPLFPCIYGKCKSEKCHCTSGYTGILCERLAASCMNLTCDQNNDCVIVRGVPNCYCRWHPGAYEMNKNCVIVANACFNNPCKHESTCTPNSFGYSCACSGGFTGKRCSVEYKNCEEKPCRNGASCQMRNNTYVCTCKWPFIGRTCEIDVNLGSRPFLCQNGGKRVTNMSGYHCMCSLGYTGVFCEETLDICDSQNPCLNDGVCHRSELGSKCVCLHDYGGKLCDRKELLKQKAVNQVLSSRVNSRAWKIVIVALAFVAACFLIWWLSQQVEPQPDSEWSGSSKSSKTRERAKKYQRKKSYFSFAQMGTLTSAIARRLSQHSPGRTAQSAKADSSKTRQKPNGILSTFFREKL